MNIIPECEACGRKAGDVTSHECSECRYGTEYKYITKAPWVLPITKGDINLQVCTKCRRAGDPILFKVLSEDGTKHENRFRCCICLNYYNFSSEETQNMIKAAIHSLNNQRRKLYNVKELCECGRIVITRNIERHLQTIIHEKNLKKRLREKSKDRKFKNAQQMKNISFNI